MKQKRKEEAWFLMTKKDDFFGIAKQFQIDPVLARIIRNRDVIGSLAIQSYLYPSFSCLHDPMLLKDMENSISILVSKIEQKKKIRIVSDYDVDGMMSNYILLKGFKRVGAVVDYEIPDRKLDGYGINERIIDDAKKEGVDTIITCDNGIAAHSQIAHGKQLGMTIIVTDHHDVPYEEVEGEKQYKIPPADTVINPKQEDCSYPFSLICGATVALKLIQALYRYYGIEKEIEEFFEFAAIATVCDVVDLQGENRTLVQEGLKRLNNTKNIGLKQLIQVTGLEDKKIASYHLGFVLGPCFNASGRLETAKMGLELLLETDLIRAKQRATEVKMLNDIRKDMTEQGVQAAIEQVETTEIGQDTILVIYLPDCHESLAGIIAGRVREAFAKPVFVITKAEDGGLKGSGRSIEAYSMFEELTKCKELLTKFGGHPMAAGLSMAAENLLLFRKKINEITTLTKEDLVEKVYIDVPMPIEYIKEEIIEQLEWLEPFGKGNRKPLFAQKSLKVIQIWILGKNKNVLKMKLESGDGYQIDSLYFGDLSSFMEQANEIYGQEALDQAFQGRRNPMKIDVIYYPNCNEFQGQKTLQIFIEHYKFQEKK